MSWFAAVAVAFAVAACGGAPRPEPPSSHVAKLTPGPSTPSSVTDRATVEWPEVHLAFRSFGGIPVERAKWPVGGTATQSLMVGGDDGERISWRLRQGTGIGLHDVHDDRRDWAFADGDTIALCGRPARVLLARHAAEDIECVMTPTGNHPARVAPRLVVAAGTMNRDEPLLAQFEVESEHAERWMPVALELLQSVRCR